MKDERKTKSQLLEELSALRNRNAALEKVANEFKQLRENLIESEEHFHSVAQNANEAIVTVNSHGNIVFWNKAAEALFGYSTQEAEGNPFTIIVPEKIKGMNVDGFWQAMKTGKSHVFNKIVETVMVDKDGKEILVETSRSLWKTSKDTFITAILRDISQRKTAQKELSKTKDHLESIIESSLDGIVAVDGEGYITKVNKAVLSLLGFKQGDMEGKHIREFTVREIGEYELVTGDKIEVFGKYFDDQKAMVVELVEKGIVKGQKSYFVRKDGKVVACEQNKSVLFDDEGNITGAVGVLKDITESARVEEELTRMRDHLDNIIESSLDSIVVSDNTGNVVRVNQAFLSRFGYTIEEVVGKHVMEFAPAEEGVYKSSTGEVITIDDTFLKMAKSEIYDRLFENGKITNWESYYLCKDGSVVPVEQNITYLFDKKGAVTGSLGVARDVTERKKAEEALKQSEEYLDNIIDSSLDSIIVTNKKGYVTRANKSFLTLLGYHEEEVMGKHMAEFSPMETGSYQSTAGESVTVTKEQFDKIASTMVLLAKERKLSNFEFYLHRKDGKVIPVEESIVYFYDKDGSVSGAVGVIRDITERKLAEREIREGKEFLEKIIKGSKDGIIISDEAGRILSVNEAVEQMLNLSKEEIVGKHTSELIVDEEEEKKKVLEKIEKMFESGFASYETRYKRRDGSYVEIECYSSLIKDEKENIIAGLSIARDITERKQMQQQLFQSEKLRSLGELAGGVAHDFNNILAAILGRVQLLKMQFKTPSGVTEKRKSMVDLVRSLEIIEKASFDGAETVRRIQEFSRKRADDKEFIQLNINELLDNALDFTRVRWKDNAESKGIKFDIHKTYSPVPSTLGSASELREVFTNLINNALDAMPEGGTIEVNTALEESTILIDITDTGVGIPEELQTRIFDPFFTTKGVQSTGLGMSISYGIISRHKGTVAVKSAEGKGTTFTIKLPVAEKPLEKRETVKSVPLKQREAKILIIEDEDEVRQLLSDILTSEGHKVEVASNGSEGIEIFKSTTFDLVFSDLGMPDMSGWEVADAIKRVNSLVPIVLITGWNVEKKNSEKENDCVDEVIQKPFEVKQVLRTVQEIMEHKEQVKAG
jgi:PAS domain S-box-containing protein